MILYYQIELTSAKVSAGYTSRLMGNVVGYSELRDGEPVRTNKMDEMEG